MAAKKKQSKSINKLSWLKPTSPLKGMLLFAVIFAVVGGGYLAYKSFAATAVKPPLNLTNYQPVTGITATDGYKAKLFCIYTTSATGFGSSTPCYQVKASTAADSGTTWIIGQTQFRAGAYNMAAGKFLPSSTWATFNRNMLSPVLCSNVPYYFMGANLAVNTPYGPMSYGQVYRKTSTGVWQVSWVNYYPLAKTCDTPSTWYNVKAGFQITN